MLEGYSSKKLRFEEQALVIAIRDTFLPRMQGRDASVFITLVTDVWPNVDIPMVFRGDDDILDKLPDSQSRTSSKNSSRIRTAKSADSTKSVRGRYFACIHMPITTAAVYKFMICLSSFYRQIRLYITASRRFT